MASHQEASLLLLPQLQPPMITPCVQSAENSLTRQTSFQMMVKRRHNSLQIHCTTAIFLRWVARYACNDFPSMSACNSGPAYYYSRTVTRE